MLTLTRRVGESLLIGNDIEIRVTQISGGQVKLSIKAPNHVNVVRKELIKGVA